MRKRKYLDIEREFEEQDIYTEDGVLDYSENDVISPNEEGFMLGYLSA